MTDHGLRLRRLSVPNPVSTISAPPSNNHGPCPPAGGCVGGPVEASAVPADGETDGASASTAGDGEALAVDSAGVAFATLPPGGIALCVSGAAVGTRGGGQTWLNETTGGRLPVPTE
jgi:hypothetical protein